MIHVLSLLQLLEKQHDVIQTENPSKGLKTLASTEENELYFVFENAMTFHGKGENNYSTDNLDSSKLSVTGEDCRA